MVLDIPSRWQAPDNPSQIATSRFIEQQISWGQRYISKEVLKKYLKNRWPWAAGEIIIKVYNPTPNTSSFSNAYQLHNGTWNVFVPEAIPEVRVLITPNRMAWLR